MKAFEAVLLAQHFDKRVGIGHRGGLVVQHHDEVLRGAAESEHVARDARSAIDQQIVERNIERAHRIDQPRLRGDVERRHTGHTAGGGQHQYVLRPAHQHVAELLLARQHMADVVARREAEQDVDIAQAQVGVEHHHPLTAARQGDGQIGDHIGLAHPALAAGDGDDLGRGALQAA